MLRDGSAIYPSTQLTLSTMATSSLMEDYYSILGVPRNANTMAIRENCKRLAMLRHPDKNNGNDKATADFQPVSLTHPQKIAQILS